MEKKYHASVVCGRFAPFHNGHYHLLCEAAKDSERLIVLVGSANRSRNCRTPFNFEERKAMIIAAMGNPVDTELNGLPADFELTIVPVEDSAYDNIEWANRVCHQIKSLIKDSGHSDIRLVACRKDENAKAWIDYPSLGGFTQKWIKPYLCANGSVADATRIRNTYFQSAYKLDGVPLDVSEWLENWKNTKDYEGMVEYFNLVEEYKRITPKLSGLNTVATACTVLGTDSEKNHHVLLIVKFPCFETVNTGRVKGLYAVPSSTLRSDESLYDGAIRALKEETDFAMKNAGGSYYASLLFMEPLLQKVYVFDDINREDKGRVIMHNHLFRTETFDYISNLDVKGHYGAMWYPLNKLGEIKDKMYADHYQMLCHILYKNGMEYTT